MTQLLPSNQIELGLLIISWLLPAIGAIYLFFKKKTLKMQDKIVLLACGLGGFAQMIALALGSNLGTYEMIGFFFFFCFIEFLI